TVLVWDDRKQKEVIELEFKSAVTGVRLRRDRIVVALANKLFVYTFNPTPQKLNVIETADNPNGLIALCPNTAMSILAFPGRQPGHVQLIDLSNPKRSPTIIAAHETALSCLSINIQGDMLATASEKGTLIRIFDTQMGIKLHELRRGAEKAQIYSINFNSDSSKLCVSSDKGTIHVFDISAYGKNKQSSLVSAKSYLPKYFSSTWSFAKFSVPESRCICAFTADDCVLVLSIDGSLYKYSLAPDGEAKRESFSKFLELEDENAPVI
ncbi:WD repeat domain phosphoinositide-interacting protein 3, partial [Sphaeroforma arctica JP610]